MRKKVLTKDLKIGDEVYDGTFFPNKFIVKRKYKGVVSLLPIDKFPLCDISDDGLCSFSVNSAKNWYKQ